MGISHPVGQGYHHQTYSSKIPFLRESYQQEKDRAHLKPLCSKVTQLSQAARYDPGWADNLTQPSCLAKPGPYRHICDETWNNNTSQPPTSSSLLLCSFCCSMRFCRSASSCFLYFSWSFSCCCCQWGSERFLFSCCSLRNSRRRVDSPGRLTMELKQRGGFYMTKHSIKERIRGALGMFVALY